MKAGTQHGDADSILRVMAGFGVNHICSRLPSAKLDESWTVESLTRLKERVESFGLTLDMVPLPAQLERDLAQRERGDPARDRARPRAATRRHVPDDPQYGARRHSVGQIQPDVPGRAANRGDARPGPRALQHLRLRDRQAGSAAHDRRPESTPISIGNASPIFSSASFPWPRSTRCGSPAIRRTPACRKGRGGAASKRSSVRSTASSGFSRSPRASITA